MGGTADDEDDMNDDGLILILIVVIIVLFVVIIIIVYLEWSESFAVGCHPLSNFSAFQAENSMVLFIRD